MNNHQNWLKNLQNLAFIEPKIGQYVFSHYFLVQKRMCAKIWHDLQAEAKKIVKLNFTSFFPVEVLHSIQQSSAEEKKTTREIEE